MVAGELVALSTVKVLSTGLALILVLLALRAWKASRDHRMLRLSLGFGLLLASLLAEGLVFQVLAPGDLALAHLVEAGTQLTAFAVMIWALF